MVEKKAKEESSLKTEKKVSVKSVGSKSSNHKNVSTGTITVIQVASPIGREQSQRSTLIGLGLNKIRRSKTLQDTPDIRGMINKVKHLVKVLG